MPKVIGLSKTAKRLGFKIGDELLKIGGYDVVDELDYLFYDNEDKFEVEVARGGKRKTIKVKKSQPLGLDADWEMKPAVCKNHCIFCFVDQLPEGMRESLYVKDDDYRFSFISGSYVTMTNVTDADIDRIIRLRLSPLYISVHAFDDDVRQFMLKNPNTRKLRGYMKRLGENGILMHTQLVVVPGINDGKVLEDSIRGLKEIEGVQTVAVVPVGLTEHRAKLANLRAVDENNAKETIALVEKLHVELGGFCWCSDEYYVKANIPVGDCAYYGAFDQIENGVGMLADFDENFKYSLDETESVNLNKRVDMITGTSFAPILKKYMPALEDKLGIRCNVNAVVNDFFGHTVTVAGLLTAADIINQVERGADAYALPDNMLREFSDTFLDNRSVKEVETALGAPIIVVPHSGRDFAKCIVEHFAK
ncbi:MAG: DUF512 domain-containing protein [Bacteroides sp.]|nr:DUF512 domain-containing protein [Bacillota bacterium]MCM1393615.1 DUF512 domain-containing protein [[Eubacterium] siraeum]MCM1456125.1 DUF512 domain-containing protein [Bacteroides sp.]